LGLQSSGCEPCGSAGGECCYGPTPCNDPQTACDGTGGSGVCRTCGGPGQVCCRLGDCGSGCCDWDTGHCVADGATCAESTVCKDKVCPRGG
jgi:hypothetical protein